jgi:hypothetical protein
MDQQQHDQERDDERGDAGDTLAQKRERREQGWSVEHAESSSRPSLQQ